MGIPCLEIIFRLFLAALLGGAVGFERETHNRPAGFRTHILVCVGAALMMLVSAYGFGGKIPSGYGVDPGRIAASVVSGVGFLGAGTIMRHRGSIQGLTTAATIWVVSGIGLASGIGFYTGAVAGTVLVLVSLYLLGWVDQTILSQRRLKGLWIRALDQPGLMGRAGAVLGEFQINIRTLNLGPPEYDPALKAEVITMEFLVTVPQDLELNLLFRRLSCLKGILSVSWEGEEIIPGPASVNSDTIL
ncbi:MAG TPA: MgtC/SapB family protein [Firmicutes bacterium]|nr:MgtC/SapB family protein [Bacillota bacterium]